jgi:hypothetical protein
MTTLDVAGLTRRELRAALRCEFADDIDAIWHAVYSGSLNETGVHFGAGLDEEEREQEAARIADSGARRYLHFLAGKVLSGQARDAQQAKRGGSSGPLVFETPQPAARRA